MDDMLKDFVVEALDLATNVESLLLVLERNPEDMDTLNGVFRSFHTIKGGAGFMGLPAMVSACHLTENLFDALRTSQIPVTPLAIEAALQASGFVEDQLSQLANGAAPDSLAAMPTSLEKILTDAIEGKSASGEAPPVAAPAANTDAVSDGVDWDALYRAVVPEGTIAASTVADASTAPVETAAQKSWDGVDRRGEGNKEAKVTAPVKEDSIRVDAVKLDALLEVAGESMQAANQASVLLEKLQQFKFEEAASGLMEKLAETLGRASRYSAELQRATLATRMQPVGRLFQKFPRLVRELAKDLGKEVDLNIEGADTEVDRVVVDSLYDPLVHMLRNSLDHGIEMPAERVAAGKSAKSVISLKAWQEANSVIIELTDDGKGMNPQVLRDKAIAKGLIHESAAQTDEAAFQLVFLPGFSTKEVASSVSGRGVGMDVVKTAVEKHRGSIYIDSALGRGTRFSIRLPIELSIVPTMLVSTADAVLGMPMGVVQRVVELPENLMSVAGSPVFHDQGLPLPVLSLASVLGYTPADERVGVVIAAPQPYILAVAAVDGTADLVIKPMTALSVEGITGTAHSAEGKLVLIVGLTFLLEGCRHPG
ncbi:chemotaxis protein CheA [Sulfuriferula thiophila]|uniref:chemotaxis protein CheA n=1 Tax=Sulfuriferula thiophila TaxID=1781211 RepID=UPI000F607D67|nr:chemotaxis protein CheA [Sulfuriferula thiophila]